MSLAAAVHAPTTGSPAGSGLLRRALLADAVVSGGTGLLLLLGGGPLGELLALPSSLLL